MGIRPRGAAALALAALFLACAALIAGAQRAAALDALEGFYTRDGETYYYENGAPCTGLLELDGRLYSFREDGTLARCVDGGAPMVALTFDDGPSRHTVPILDTLECYHAGATFFVVGNRVEAYTDILRREAALGLLIGNHTYTHTNLTRLSPADAAQELRQTDDVVCAVIGRPTALLRPPEGSQNQQVRALAGMPLILWSIDTMDWYTKNADQTVRTVLETVQDGDIILMHDLYAASAEAVEVLVPALLEAGYQLVTVEELAHFRAGGLEPGEVYSSFYPEG